MTGSEQKKRNWTRSSTWWAASVMKLRASWSARLRMQEPSAQQRRMAQTTKGWTNMRKSQKRDKAQSANPQDRFSALVAKAQTGDKNAMEELRPLLAERPAYMGHYGRFAESNRSVLLSRVCGNNLMFVDGMERRLNELQKELAGTDPSALELLLVERILTCWLEVNYYDGLYTQNMQDLTLRQSEHGQRRQERAHRRLLSSIKALALVRRLQLPTVQVNIGEKQVNVVSAVAGTTGQLPPGQNNDEGRRDM